MPKRRWFHHVGMLIGTPVSRTMAGAANLQQRGATFWAVKYVPGLDGLRAVAVIAVLLFHAEFSFASGGFLGVSLFFTLSGFLITTLLLDEHDATGTLSMRRFYGRRVRRLLPAAYVCLLLVIVLSGWWSASQLRALPGDLLAAVANVANWRFAFSSTSYQDLFTNEPSPVAHFWSLAIEEQIYLVLPLIVFAALRRRRGQRSLALVTGVLLAASIIATWLTSDRDLVYNGTQTRAAELLVGVALAQLLRRRTQLVAPPAGRSWIVGSAALAGFVVLVGVASLQQSWVYDGGLVGVALISAVLITAAVDGRFPANLLAIAPLVAIGKVSYGIYLYHWPVFLLLDEQRTGLDQIPLFVLRCLVTAALTMVSYRLIEQPIRRGNVIGRDRVMVPTMIVSAVAVAAAAVLIVPAPRLTDTEQLLALGSQEVVEFDATPAGAAASASQVAGATTVPVVTVPAVTVPAVTVPARLAVVGSDPATAAALVASNRSSDVDIIEDSRADCPLSSRDTAGCESLFERWVAVAATATGPVDVLVLVTNAAEIADERARESGVVSDEQLRAVAENEEAMIASILATIDAALDVGTDVVWYTPAQPSTAFFRHFARIGVERPGVRTVVGGSATLADAVETVLDERASDQAVNTAETADDADIDGLRILVIGDSTSLSFARALNDSSNGRLTVLWAGANGCPLAPVEATRGQAAGEWSASVCEPWPDKVPALVDSFEPDALLVMTGPMELVEHRFAGDPVARIAGDPVFASARDVALEELLAVLPAGLPVLVADFPAITIGGFSGTEMTSPERLAAVNAQVAAWDSQLAQVERFAYRDPLEAAEAALAPSGKKIRSDGTHPDVEPLAELTRDTYVAQLIAQVTRLRTELREASGGD
jgi:peptidoglycan/LPS O-acetylase OafA/YrhL